MKNILLAVLILGAAGARAADEEILMGALGDSITVAAIADVALPPQGLPGPNEVDPYFLWDNKATLSWVSGAKIASHHGKLGEFMRSRGDLAKLAILNVAENGKRSVDIPAQAEKLVQAMKTGKYLALRYVTILVGANDACSTQSSRGTPSEKIVSSLADAFAKLASIQQAEPVHVLVSLIPPVAELGQPRVRYAKTIFGMTCERIRSQVFKLCDSLVAWKNEEEYRRASENVARVNAAIRSAAEAGRSTHRGKLEIALSGRLADLPISLDILAADCFHPNAGAQQLIADQLWLDQPWFR